ncbi:MAG TPA: BatA and WFA domain-containing protein [Pirellulales bacterium]|nr:BatA and WFA domain-containing protein [Pirellulales bacterium]
MAFTNPSALAWLALAIPIVIFYILKIRLRRLPVSTILFWQQIFEEKQPRSIWEHLRHLLSLLVQLAMLALLVLALAEPFFDWEMAQARRLVLVLDNSASMRATDVAPSRFEHARDIARHYIDRLRPRDEMALVVAGTQPRVVCGLAAHRRTLWQALDTIEPSDGPTRVPEAVELARRLVSGGENGRVIVLSDGCFDDATQWSAGKDVNGKDVELVAVGTHAANIGITRFQVRRSLLDPIGYEILAEVQNASVAPAHCRLELDLGPDVVDVVPLSLKPGEVWTHLFEKTSAEGGVLAARLDHGDARAGDVLAGDDRAWALLPRRELLPVTLVTAGNLFLEKVFEANPLVKLSVVEKLPAQVAPGSITVFHRQVPERLPDGPVWVIDPLVACDVWQVGDKLDNPIVTKQDKDSPLMAHVRLDNVIMPEARRLAFNQPPQVLVGAVTGEPLYAYLERPAGKLLVLSVNLDQGDLPLRTAFPIMATNALGWFAGHRGELRESLASGTVTELDLLPPGQAHGQPLPAEHPILIAPGGRRQPLPPGLAKTTVGPLDECGVWQLFRNGGEAPAPNEKSAEKPDLELACNLANRRESDVRTPEELLQNQERRTPTTVAAGLLVHPMWFYLIVLAWLLAAVEWYLYQRRWIS